jgi:hypothetical protein
MALYERITWGMGSWLSWNKRSYISKKHYGRKIKGEMLTKISRQKYQNHVAINKPYELVGKGIYVTPHID